MRRGSFAFSVDLDAENQRVLSCLSDLAAADKVGRQITHH